MLFKLIFIAFQLIERSTFHVDNCYSIPNIKINAYVCKTNLPSNTAFRGFGAPQVMLAAESMIRQIASTLGKSYEEIVEVNIYKEGSVTYYNQLLTYCTLSRCWNQCIDSSRYIARKKAVNDFNRLDDKLQLYFFISRNCDGYVYFIHT